MGSNFKNTAKALSKYAKSNNIYTIGIETPYNHSSLAYLLNHTLTDSGIQNLQISRDIVRYNNEYVTAPFLANTTSTAKAIKSILKEEEVQVILIDISLSEANSLDKIDPILDRLMIASYHRESLNYLNQLSDLLSMLKHSGEVFYIDRNESLTNGLHLLSDSLEHEVVAKRIPSHFISAEEYTPHSYRFKSKAQLYFIPKSEPEIAEFSLLTLFGLSDLIHHEQIKDSFKSYTHSTGFRDKVTSDPFTIFIDGSQDPHEVIRLLYYLQKVKKKNSRIITVTGLTHSQHQNEEIYSKDLSIYSDILLLSPNDPGKKLTADINNKILEEFDHFTQVLKRFESFEEYKSIDINTLKNKVFQVLHNENTPVVVFDEHKYTGRLNAIECAVRLAQKDDIIVVFGKGKHTNIRFGRSDYQWSDYRAVEEALSTVGVSAT